MALALRQAWRIGCLSVDLHLTGQNFPAIQDILRYVVDRGDSKVTSRDEVGENFYNRGVMNAVLIAEAIRTAQRLIGRKLVTGEDLRRGLETLEITDARWKEIGLPGFAPLIHMSCIDHKGHGALNLTQWDGNRWINSSNRVEPLRDKVQSLIDRLANDYIAAAPGWSKRTEPCEQAVAK